jgi:hypothetical protein
MKITRKARTTVAGVLAGLGLVAVVAPAAYAANHSGPISYTAFCPSISSGSGLNVAFYTDGACTSGVSNYNTWNSWISLPGSFNDAFNSIRTGWATNVVRVAYDGSGGGCVVAFTGAGAGWRFSSLNGTNPVWYGCSNSANNGKLMSNSISSVKLSAS